MRAIKLVFENIETAYLHGDNLDARTNMHNASALAGMAFSNVSLGLIHSLAHKIGGEFGVTHGLANAILLPYIISYNKQSTNKYAEIEQYLNITSIEDELRALNAKLNIPLTFKEITEVDITETQFNTVLDRMSENAFNDPCTLTNPGTPTIADIKNIYQQSFFGNK